MSTSSGSQTCAVTIAGPDRRLDVVVPSRTPIGELIPTFVELGTGEAPDPGEPQPVWTVAPPGRQPLPLDRTLADCGIADGAVLTLTPLRSERRAPPVPRSVHRPEQHRGSPAERTAAVLPEHLDRGQRMSAAVKAFFGHEPEEPVLESAEPSPSSHRDVLTKLQQRSAGERARNSWRETDYEARLHRERRAAAEPLRDDRRRVPEGRRRQDDRHGAAGFPAGQRAPGPHRRGRTNPDYGSLGRTLTPDHGVYVDDLVDVLDQPTSASRRSTGTWDARSRA